MYINIYKANSYSYTDKNFKTLEEATKYLNVSDCLDFKTDKFSGELSANVNDWEITLKEGDMPNEGEGFVDMSYESGALEDCY